MAAINLLNMTLRVAGQSFTAAWLPERRAQSFLFTGPWQVPICCFIVLLSTVGCSIGTPGNDVPYRDEQFTAYSGGIFPRFTPGELYEISDTVVIGGPTDHRVLQKLAASSPTYPDGLREEHADLVVEVKIFAFTVDSYIKGEGADVIENLTDAGAERPILEEGNSYMLYLYQPVDRAFWEYTHRVHGIQGVWRIVEGEEGQDIARQDLLPDGEKMTLRDLMESRTGSRLSASLRQRFEARAATWGD